MKVPLSWLREYVDFDGSAGELADKLTFSGTEVEGLETVGVDCELVVSAEVLSVQPHPGAEGLLLCRVTEGRESLQVVCGARNVRVGDKVVLAKVGAVLPGGLRVEPRTIAGEPSAGMLCAEDELGLTDDHSGILILQKEIKPGLRVDRLLGSPETVLKIEITWNRPDCLCLIGIAREVAALYRKPLKKPEPHYSESEEPVARRVQVALEDRAGCPRYTARMLSSIQVGPSPLWMRRRLHLCGVRPISNVVDVTNYVMLETGQPLHAFDYDLLEGGRIVVRRARPGEGLSTLDGLNRPITPEMLVIADGTRPVALAGIMGGAGSEIRETTRRVLLESACFDPALIHSTSVRLGLATESSHRFERGVDEGGAEWASRRAMQLMVQHAAGVALKGVIDEYPQPRAERRVTCRYQKVRGLIGLDIPDAEIVGILDSLQLPVVDRNDQSCVVSAPTFRPDLEREADLIEEVARIHGLDKLPETLPRAPSISSADDSASRAVIACRTNLTGLGLTEILNYSFISHKLLDLFFGPDRGNRVELPNPVSAEHSVLRNSLVPQLVETLGRNWSRQVEEAAFFEIGRVFVRSPEGRLNEELRLAIGLMGKVGRAGVEKRRAADPLESYLWMKGLVESLLAAQRVTPAGTGGLGESVVLRSKPELFLEPGTAVSVLAGGNECGYMGLVRTSVRAEWRISVPVVVAEFAVEPLCRNLFAVRPARSVPVYPSISRDVALLADRNVTHEQVLRVIRKAAGVELTGVDLFDIFTGEAIGESKRSLAYTLTYRSADRTLTDEEANRFHESIKESLKRELSVEIR